MQHFSISLSPIIKGREWHYTSLAVEEGLLVGHAKETPLLTGFG